MINTKNWDYKYGPEPLDNDNDPYQEWYWVWDALSYEQYQKAVEDRWLETPFGVVQLENEVVGLQKNFCFEDPQKYSTCEVHQWRWRSNNLNIDVELGGDCTLSCIATDFDKDEY